MTICILAFETEAVYWCLACVSILVLLFPIVRAIDEMRIFGKSASVVVATGLLEFCFLGVVYIVAHNKAFQCIIDNNAFFLLAALLIYAACAVCLCVATVLGSIVKTLRTKKENTDGI